MKEHHTTFTPCPECRREHEDQLELLEMLLSNEHPTWSRVRLKWRAIIEYAKGVRVQERAS
jgi:hypothetical protein